MKRALLALLVVDGEVAGSLVVSELRQSFGLNVGVFLPVADADASAVAGAARKLLWSVQHGGARIANKRTDEKVCGVSQPERICNGALSSPYVTNKTDRIQECMSKYTHRFLLLATGFTADALCTIYLREAMTGQQVKATHPSDNTSRPTEQTQGSSTQSTNHITQPANEQLATHNHTTKFRQPTSNVHKPANIDDDADRHPATSIPSNNSNSCNTVTIGQTPTTTNEPPQPTTTETTAAQWRRRTNERTTTKNERHRTNDNERRRQTTHDKQRRRRRRANDKERRRRRRTKNEQTTTTNNEQTTTTTTTTTNKERRRQRQRTKNERQTTNDEQQTTNDEDERRTNCQ